VRISRSIKKFWNGVVAIMRMRLTKCAKEAVDGLLQLTKRLVHGFRSLRHCRIMTYHKVCKLQLDLPPFDTYPPTKIARNIK
jgi:transposase